MAVSKRVRFEVLHRDGHTCRYCGAAAPDVRLTVDHVIPHALGGRDDPTNLVTACAACNSGKSSTTPDGEIVADVAASALHWTHAMQQAAQIRAAELTRHRHVAAEFDAIWRGYVLTVDGDTAENTPTSSPSRSLGTSGGSTRSRSSSPPAWTWSSSSSR